MEIIAFKDGLAHLSKTYWKPYEMGKRLASARSFRPPDLNTCPKLIDTATALFEKVYTLIKLRYKSRKDLLDMTDAPSFRKTDILVRSDISCFQLPSSLQSHIVQ